MNAKTKLITVALVGEPNAGKSTLLNSLVGEKVSIVTHKVQTTRKNIRGIVNSGNTQIVFIDTPGIFQPDRTLERAIVKEATTSFDEADIICIIIDAKTFSEERLEFLLSKVKNSGKPLVAVLNKADLVYPRENMLPILKVLSDKNIFSEFFAISALNNQGVDKLISVLCKNAIESDWIYEEDQISDKSLREICEEITREKAYLLLHEEIPYSLKIETDKWDEDEERAEIYQTIFVTKENQKMIVLGKAGSKIKEIGKQARFEMSKLIGKKVSLYLFVKVREDWIEKDFGRI